MALHPVLLLTVGLRTRLNPVNIRQESHSYIDVTANLNDTQDYYYPNYQSARTLWYHDHAIHVTSLNAYQGQAGLYILYDPVEEARLALPSGSYDIPLMLASVQIERNGQLKSIVDERTSMYGDVFLVVSPCPAST